jgi:glycosyltransferase involved in cell wall biosynthesis
VVRRLGRHLDKLEARLVHIYFDESIVVGWLAVRCMRHPAKLLSSRRDMGLGTANQPWYHRLFPLMLAGINRDFAAIVANSEAVRNYAARREHTPLSRYVVLRNGVELPGSTVMGGPAADAGGQLRVGIVASLTPVKRHDVLLRAWARCSRASTPRQTQLLLIGDGPERFRLEELARDLDLGADVVFVGAVPDVQPWLRSLAIGVLCSDREGLSNAILEYMAWGLPVVATSVGGNPELVTEDNGLLVPPAAPDALASALQRLLGDPALRERMGRASARNVRDVYSWDASMTALMACYDDILSH